MTIRYSIVIDGDHDGRAENEIRGQVIEMRWRLGMRQAYDSLAEKSWARVTVDNRTGAFSPERNRLTPGTRLRIQSLHDGSARTHFSGVLSHIEPEAGDWSRKLAIIHLHDMQVWLESSPARLPPQVDVTADQVIEALLAGAAIVPAAIAGYCLINIAGYNNIDAVRIFAPLRPPQRLERGKTRFAYVGDWWRETTSIRAAIGDIVASERGRFYVDRAGKAVFLNRHKTLVHDSIAAEFDDNMSGMDYSYGDQRLNQLTLLMRPREIGVEDSLLWQLPSALRIAPRSEIDVTLRLRDDRDQPVGLLRVDRLISRFFLSADGSGDEITRNVAAEVLRAEASSAVVRVRNRRRQAVYLTLLRLHGQALYRRDPLGIVLDDGEGMYRYGIKRLTLDLPALSDIATAQAFAAYEVARRKHPRGTIHSLQINAREQPAALKLSLFDRIRISERQTGHTEKDYFIIGEEHRVNAGGKSHEVSWTLEPADSTRFVIVNQSAINNSAEVLTPY